MKNSFIKIFYLIFSMFALISCGGGSGGDSGDENTTVTIPQGTEFSLAILYSATPSGIVLTENLSGTSTTGSIYTGSFSRTNSTKIMLNGVLVTPSVEDTSLTLVQNGLTQNFSKTTYIDDSGFHISSIDSDGVTCSAASPAVPPLLVKVGDTGAHPLINCDDNSSYEVTWKVEDNSDGTILYIESGTHRDNGVVVATFIITTNINDTGDLVSFKSVTTTLNSGNVLTLQSI